MTDARQGWNAAQRASERPLPKPRKVHGPVGVKRDVGDAYFVDGTPAHVDNTKPCCGYHVCSCKPVPKQMLVGSWAWAHERMKAGCIVTRRSWQPAPSSVLRIGENGFESRYLNSNSDEWKYVHVDQLEFDGTNDWHVLDVPGQQRQHAPDEDARRFNVNISAKTFALARRFNVNISAKTFALWQTAETKPLTRQRFDDISRKLLEQTQVAQPNAPACLPPPTASDKDHGPK